MHAVLMGGYTHEAQISLDSCRLLCAYPPCALIHTLPLPLTPSIFIQVGYASTGCLLEVLINLIGVLLVMHLWKCTFESLCHEFNSFPRKMCMHICEIRNIYIYIYIYFFVYREVCLVFPCVSVKWSVKCEAEKSELVFCSLNFVFMFC